MSINVAVSSSKGKTEVMIPNYPDICPICHHGIDTRYWSGFLKDDNLNVEIVYQCPIKTCHSLFIGHYKMEGGNLD